MLGGRLGGPWWMNELAALGEWSAGFPRKLLYTAQSKQGVQNAGCKDRALGIWGEKSNQG